MLQSDATQDLDLINVSLPGHRLKLIMAAKQLAGPKEVC